MNGGKQKFADEGEASTFDQSSVLNKSVPHHVYFRGEEDRNRKHRPADQAEGAAPLLYDRAIREKHRNGEVDQSQQRRIVNG